MTDVVAEVKVLQNLVERLYAAREVEAASGGQFADAVPDAEGEMTAEGAAVLDIVREALRQDRIDVFLQPVVSLPQRKRRFYECFTRIRGADGSFVLPEQYIQVAEEAGLIAAIDNMLLFRGVQLVRRSQRRHFDLGFFCNISPHTMRDREFFGDFVEFMEENAELSPNLVFEFAQSAVAQQDAETRADLQRLAAMGFRFAMDGVTDLDLDPEELAARHFKFVKVDCALLLAKARAESPVLDLREHGQVRARKPAHDLRSLKAALDAVGIDLIVEKIESDTDLVELLEYNIDFGQGYLFGEPRAAPALDEASD
jgi:cyclic-di-GMP phosphodiesterase TipF (flagellum assembly factor)